jgi:hypothetical protein
MTVTSVLPDSSLYFFRLLFIKTGGDTQKQVSMHEIGNEAGMDKPVSKSTAEELMSLGLIDIRTLSGGIGLTAEGVLEAKSCFADISGSNAIGSLGNRPIVEEKIGAIVMEILTQVKHKIGKLGLSYENLTEILADTQSLEAQMRSPRPKTAIVRECFRSMLPLLKSSGETETHNRISAFLQD